MRRPDRKLVFRPELYYDSNQKILRCFSKHLIKGLIEHEDGLSLPKRLGTLQMIGTQALGFDWVSSIKHKKKIYFDNNNTSGYKYYPSYNPILFNNRFIKNPRMLNKFYKFKAYDKLKQSIKAKIDDKDFHHWLKID